MSLHNRSGPTGARGSHWKNPLMVSGGPLDDVPHAVVDNALSPYKVYYEDFREQLVDGQLDTMGWTYADLGGAGALQTVASEHALVFDCLTSNDQGGELQFDIPSTAASLGSTHNIIPEMTSSTTLMDGREIFFQVRMGTVPSSATDNDGKYLFGIFTKDTTVLDASTGLPLVDAGGGFGFHKGELGAVTALSTNAAITAAGQALVPAVSELAMTVSVPNWHTYAARCRIIDASAGTGITDFWYDGVHRGRIENTQPFDSTEVYSFTFAACNGPAQDTDLHIDYILTGITRPGLTWPYTNGVIY